ncbi:hypothetical protein LINPERHAP1_LOCUS25477, partial [Linum perenne]
RNDKTRFELRSSSTQILRICLQYSPYGANATPLDPFPAISIAIIKGRDEKATSWVLKTCLAASGEDITTWESSPSLMRIMSGPCFAAKSLSLR